MAKKNTKPVNKNVSNQNAPKAGFVQWFSREQEIADRIANRNKVLSDLEKKSKPKAKKKKK